MVARSSEITATPHEEQKRPDSGTFAPHDVQVDIHLQFTLSGGTFPVNV